MKQILLDETANSKLNRILESISNNPTSTSATGLIIGTIDPLESSNRDYIVDVIETPFNDDQQTAKKQGNSTSGDASKLDSTWIVNHALQVHDMLLGGMDILGIYCIDLQPAQAKQLLAQIFKCLNGFVYYKKMKFNTERLLFQIDTAKKSINMKSFALNDDSSAKTMAKPSQCELTVVPGILKSNFIRINSNLVLDNIFKTPNIKSNDLLKEDFYNSISVDDMFDETKFVCLINEMYVDEKSSSSVSDLIRMFNELNIPMQTNMALDNQLIQVDVKLLENLSRKNREKEEIKISNMDSLYDLKGVCSLALYVTKETNIGQIQRMLIYDLLRSMYARIRLLVEDLDFRKEIIGDEELEDDPNSEASSTEESYQTPNRILVYLSNNIIICDYVIPDETFMDISERIKEIFNYEIENEKKIVYAEDLPPEIKSNSELRRGSSVSSSSGSLSTRIEKTHHGDDMHLSGSSSRLKSNDEKQKMSYFISAIIIGIFSLIIMYFSMKSGSAGHQE